MKKQTVSPILYISYEKFVEHYNNKEVTLLVDKHDYDNTEVELLASKHQDEILEHISNNKLV